jgi:outer membrane protein OmpA-like peptidoglycan-associated protein
VVKISISLAAAALLLLGAPEVVPAQAPAAGASASQGPTVNRTAPAVAYGQRRGSTRVTLQGTALMPLATGEAKVEASRGAMKVEVRVSGLQSPTTLGHEYLTYNLWAISPEGRSFNLGELQLRGTRSSLNVTTPLQTFALVVTAEPYYAVRLPSDAVVLENALFVDETGQSQAVHVRYDLVGRGGYIPTGYRFDPVLLTTNLPLEFFQARNAARIAESAGAEKYAPESYATISRQMARLDELATARRVDRRSLQAAARELVQTAEDARDLSVRRADSDRVEAERIEAARREAEARARAREEEERRARAEAEREAAERARLEALEAAERDRRRQEEAARVETERARAAAAALDRKIQELLKEREELRAKLLQQLNAIFDTQDTARGLVASMSDVTFATGQATLQPQAREKLAQISGILLAHPGLHVDIEGHTDSVGSDELNQALSERRADAVRSYLAQLGIHESRTSARGFGLTRPIATNDTAEGRQMNRRVELVVSGEEIGTQVP